MNHKRWFHRDPGRSSEVSVPEGLWTKCPSCDDIVFTKDIERNLRVCPKCDYHYRLPAHDRLAMTLDEGSFAEMDAGLRSVDTLGFPDYASKLARGSERTGLNDGIVTGVGTIESIPVIAGASDFAFMGGSMGSVAGEKLVRAMERGADDRKPVVLFTASGGARMQEGLHSLMQMAKTSAAVARLGQARVPYIVVLTDPTTAGVYASYASLGDIIFAEPGAVIGFAGLRVGNQDLGVKLPPDFQRPDFQSRCGMIDRIVPRKELRATLATALSLLTETTSDGQ